jgi:hypothetical protein
VDEAVERFEELYSEKTGNEWHERHNFIKVSLMDRYSKRLVCE